MADNIDEEVSAIKAVLKALEPLVPDARVSVISYVSKRLGIPAANTSETVPNSVGNQPVVGVPSSPVSVPEVHLKDFTKQKNPKSANEMAAIVAYYLAEVVPLSQRKKSVTADDMKTYFKIGDFPLPDLRFTLPNAKNAGYFDALGGGEYQLNAVGHNLVAHSLPRSSGTGSSTRRSIRKKSKKKGSSK